MHLQSNSVYDTIKSIIKHCMSIIHDFGELGIISFLDGPSNCDSPSLQSTITPACAATGAETSINPTKALTSLAVPNSQGVCNIKVNSKS